VELIVDSYRSTEADDDRDYRFVILLDGRTFGLSHKAAVKFATAMFKELTK
jgi:hypothetical protein